MIWFNKGKINEKRKVLTRRYVIYLQLCAAVLQTVYAETRAGRRTTKGSPSGGQGKDGAKDGGDGGGGGGKTDASGC